MGLFLPFYLTNNPKKIWLNDPFTNVYHTWRSYDIWFLKYKAQKTEFFVNLGHFLPFHHPDDLENQKFVILLLPFYTMIYGSWDMGHDRQNFFVILDHFLPFYSNIDTENENFEKMKKVPQYIIILKICTINGNHNVWFLRFGAQQKNFFCHIGPFFDLLPSWQPGKLKFWKIKTLKILLFFTCAP